LCGYFWHQVAEDELQASAAGSLHSHRSLLFQKWVVAGAALLLRGRVQTNHAGGAGRQCGQLRLHLLGRAFHVGGRQAAAAAAAEADADESHRWSQVPVRVGG
jgi:hypothetical protein